MTLDHVRRPVRSHLGWHLVLALFMLLVQQAGLRHALQHATRDEGSQTHAVCLECLAHHASDASITPTVAPLALVQADHVLVQESGCAQCTPHAPRGYQPRAPPQRLAA